MSRLKFHSDGKMKWFPGNTIVSNLSHNSNVMEVIHEIQKAYQRLPFAEKFSFLPLSSVHMTVFELVCHFVRKQEKWSQYVDLDEPLDQVDSFFNDKLSTLTFIKDFQMKAHSIRGTGLDLDPIDKQTKERIKTFRDELADTTGIKFKNHDTYQFHISFAYRIEEQDSHEKQVVAELNNQLLQDVIAEMEPITIKQIDFTVFEDMSEFVPYDSQARERLRVKKEYAQEKWLNMKMKRGVKERAKE